MRKILYAVIVLVMVAGVATAQDFPRVEIFGGYDLLRFSGEDTDNYINDFTSGAPEGSDIDSSKLLKKGFDASAAFNVNEYFGIEANFLYNQGDLVKGSGEIEGEPYTAKIKASNFAFMAGPRFTYRKNDRVTPFVHALFGVSRIKDEASLVVNGENMNSEVEDFNGSDTGFGMAFGGGLDVNVNDVFAIRLVQADYFLSKHEDFKIHNFNLAFGVVLRLGGK